MDSAEAKTRILVNRANSGDADAARQLMQAHDERLRKMVRARLDQRLHARIDPSDVVQDVLLEATRKLGDYGKQQTLPFYLWLRQIACDRLFELHRQHIHVEKRTVKREERELLSLSNESVDLLAERIPCPQSTPSAQLIRKELRRRIREAVDKLPILDRELLMMRYVEQMKLRDIASALSLTESAAKSRHVRALEKMSSLVGIEETR